MRSVNPIVIPEYSEELVKASIRAMEVLALEKMNAHKIEALDYYFYDNMDEKFLPWFSVDTLKEVPPFPQKVVPRFARARMMVYKTPPVRKIDGEVNEDYNEMAYLLDSVSREWSELTWLLGDVCLRSKANREKERLEYDIIPIYREFYRFGDPDRIGISYELGKNARGERVFVYWGRKIDDKPGLHFKFTQGGTILKPAPDNEELINPYGIIPITVARVEQPGHDVVRAALQLGIAMTEIALGVRHGLGQPVVTGVDQKEASKLPHGIDKLMGLPDIANFEYKGPPGDLVAMTEAVKAFANMVAENNHLRIRWGESAGNAPSGEALRIMEIENLEARESDIQVWREFENQRYEIDRTIADVEGFGTFGEDYTVDFAEPTFPVPAKEELDLLLAKKAAGVIDQEDIIRFYNPDISDEDLEAKLSKNLESQAKETEAKRTKSPFELALGEEQ